MERLTERLQIAKQALAAFDEVLKVPFDKIVRDAAIQRFEFTVEATWKLAQNYLLEKEGLDLNSPKAVFRGCFQVELLEAEQTELALKMIDDRNLTVHTYNEILAQKIFNNLPAYYQLISALVTTIAKKAKI